MKTQVGLKVRLDPCGSCWLARSEDFLYQQELSSASGHPPEIKSLGLIG